MSASILDKQWMTLNKVQVDDILQSVSDLNVDGPRPVHIGTDAQKHGKFLDFVTVAVVLDPGKEGGPGGAGVGHRRLRSTRARRGPEGQDQVHSSPPELAHATRNPLPS